MAPHWWQSVSEKVEELDVPNTVVFWLMPFLQMALIVLWLRVLWPMVPEARGWRSLYAPDLWDLLKGIERLYDRGQGVEILAPVQAWKYDTAVMGQVKDVDALSRVESSTLEPLSPGGRSGTNAWSGAYVTLPAGVRGVCVRVSKEKKDIIVRLMTDENGDDLARDAEGATVLIQKRQLRDVTVWDPKQMPGGLKTLKTGFLTTPFISLMEQAPLADEYTPLTGGDVELPTLADDIPRWNPDDFQRKLPGKTLGAGESGGDYSAPWTQTFDLTFLIVMIVLFSSLLATGLFVPALCPWQGIGAQSFILQQFPKLAIMMAVSLFGGLLARHYSEVDEAGYVQTTAQSWFKVNYTRKIQHFAAYLIPLVMPVGHADCTPLQKMMGTAWGDWFTLLGFLVLIKPVREMPCIGKFFMLQFNSLDRPEDRPHTISWIIAGNILPGLACILFFTWLFEQMGFPHAAGLSMIFLLVAGVGDGVAEPVGVYLGRHKYKCSAIGSETKFTRTLEGSSCVWWTTLVFVQMYIFAFPTLTAFWICVAIMPPIMTFGEAFAPHTLDTPVLMGLGGFLELIVIKACDAAGAP